MFLDPDVVTGSDPTAFSGYSFVGVQNVLMFDRRIDDFTFLDAYLFDVSFSDGLITQFQINPEFGSLAAAEAEVVTHAPYIGQLPTVLRLDLQTVWIHKGLEVFGGGNNNILIHTDQADAYIADGFLEEVLVHEGAHTSLDAAHASSPGWLAAQAADADFISTYAMDHPSSEDVAESFLPWFAVRHRADRIDPALALAISATIPNRLSYFDALDVDLFPLVGPAPVPEPGTLLLFGSAASLVLARRRTRRATSVRGRAHD